MSSIPTIPVPAGGIGGSLGPEGVSLSVNLTLDKCNARPIFVYVVAKSGNIWRVFDPLSPTERLPVWKEWTEELTHVTPTEKKEPIPPPPPPPGQPPPPPPQPPACIAGRADEYVVEDTFKFDEPGRHIPVGNPEAFTDSGAPAQIQAGVTEKLNAPARDNNNQSIPLPSDFERHIVMFAHADMCAPYSYNSGLSSRRADAVKLVLPPPARGVLKNVCCCADFSPKTGPTEHELAAEQSRTGTATNPHPGTDDGNTTNRRVELLIYPEYKNGSRNRLKDVLKQVHAEVQPKLNGRFDWPEDQFPCDRGDITSCHQLTEPFDSATDPPNPRLDQREHQNADKNGTPLGTGASYRQCLFYQSFRTLISQPAPLPCQPQPTPPPSPSQPAAAQPAEPQYRTVPGEPIVTKETVGEYHPPEGEHYGYKMDEMVRMGVPCNPEFAPTVAVAPNEQANADDFNLIKAGPLRVVKMDIGFWGEQRAMDLGRKSAIKRTPARSFGMVEGQFVFLCYFQTPDNAGFVKGCSEEFDEKLTPLSAKLAKAVKDAGYKILIMAKAVADDGPDAKKLNVFFPDMHLPRKFDEHDPAYATADCLFRVQMIKSMLLHQLKRDFRLPADQTPWLAVQDRQLCRDFFEHGTAKLKLPHWNTGRRFSNPFDASGSNVVSAAADAVKKAYQALLQVGYYAFEFTQDDYRRMVRKYNEEFPEKGYGRTWDVLFNWFYGFETDKNKPPPQKTGAAEEAKSMIPALVSEVADTNFGTKLGPDPGTRPATESYDRVDAAPARDLLRFLKVIGQQRAKAGLPAQVFHTGDLCEMWANRRYLFEDFEDAAEPRGQMPGLAKKLTPGDFSSSSGGTLATLKSYGLLIVRTFLQIMLGGINAGEHDLWYRRECNKPADSDDPKHPEQDLLPSEESWNINSIDDDFKLPQFTGPGRSPGAVGLAVDPAHPLQAPSVNYTNVKLTGLKRSKERRKGYLTAEAQQRLAQIADFEAPLRQDASGKQEDQELLGGNVAGKNKDQGKWNRAVLEKFAELGTKFIYGNHDDYRGVPRNGGLALALPFYSEPGLWAEHAHRFEDSNLDGQPFGAFMTSLAYDIQELAFGEGLLDECALHREQSNFQPGILQWFLLTEFGLDTLKDFQKPPEDVPPVHRFRIAVNSHTHVPDLVVAQVVFKEREKTPWENIINLGGLVLKELLLIKQIVEWFEKWNDHHGFEKWWEDIKGNTINWGVDFAGLSKCVDKALDFINKGFQKEKKKLKDEWDASRRSLKQAGNDNARNLGLPPR